MGHHPAPLFLHTELSPPLLRTPPATWPFTLPVQGCASATLAAGMCISYPGGRDVHQLPWRQGCASAILAAGMCISYPGGRDVHQLPWRQGCASATLAAGMCISYPGGRDVHQLSWRQGCASATLAAGMCISYPGGRDVHQLPWRQGCASATLAAGMCISYPGGRDVHQLSWRQGCASATLAAGMCISVTYARPCISSQEFAPPRPLYGSAVTRHCLPYSGLLLQPSPTYSPHLITIPTCPPTLPNSPIFLPLHVPPSWRSPPSSYMTDALHLTLRLPSQPLLPCTTAPSLSTLPYAEYHPLRRASNSPRTLWMEL